MKFTKNDGLGYAPTQSVIYKLCSCSRFPPLNHSQAPGDFEQITSSYRCLLPRPGLAGAVAKDFSFRRAPIPLLMGEEADL